MTKINANINRRLLQKFALSNTINIEVVKSELTRKAIHFLIALSPLMAAWNRPFTLVFLMAGIVVYAALERFRQRGAVIPLFSALAARAGRARDNGRFVLGPVTLGLGALLVLAWFPPATAAIAVYALAFGDGFASLVGKIFGKTRPAFMFGKSVEGSLACFLAVFLTSFRVSNNIAVSLIAALTAALTEALPLGDFDNVVMPLAVALVVSLF